MAEPGVSLVMRIEGFCSADDWFGGSDGETFSLSDNLGFVVNSACFMWGGTANDGVEPSSLMSCCSSVSEKVIMSKDAMVSASSALASSASQSSSQIV